MLVDETPEVDQMINTCYYECALVEWGWNSYPNPPVTFFDPGSGRFKVQTPDYDFDGLKLQLKLTCKTPYSLQSEAETTDIDYFELVFKSECRDAPMELPTPSVSSTTATLWTNTAIAFGDATSANPDCGSVHYSVEDATVNGNRRLLDSAHDTGSSSAPLVSIDSDTNTVNVFGSDKGGDVGQIQFKIKACLKNTLYWDEINCVSSEVISI